VTRDRIEYVPNQQWENYIDTYNRIDIALDPFPFNGGITSCDALFMGVPVVTLSGRTAVGRGGRSILSNIGLPDLVAYSPEQYLKIASELAGDPARLESIRLSLRQKMQSSPLMDAKQFARDIEAVFARMAPKV
jgi:protein O-GlcNAc transferase